MFPRGGILFGGVAKFWKVWHEGVQSLPQQLPAPAGVFFFVAHQNSLVGDSWILGLWSSTPYWTQSIWGVQLQPFPCPLLPPIGRLDPLQDFLSGVARKTKHSCRSCQTYYLSLRCWVAWEGGVRPQFKKPTTTIFFWWGGGQSLQVSIPITTGGKCHRESQTMQRKNTNTHTHTQQTKKGGSHQKY